MAPRSSLVRANSRWQVRHVVLVALALLTAGLSAGAPSEATAATAGADACASPPGVTCVLGIPYEDDGSPVHTLDAYYPSDLTDRASVVIIHGGRWGSGSSGSFAAEATYLAENGFAAFSINYTLSAHGEPSWPQVRSDIDTATAWVMSHADQYHGDNARVGMLGGSSGGHLAALVDTAGPEDGAAPLAAVSWSGGMDLKIVYNQGNKVAKNGVFNLLGCRPRQCPQTYAAASPVAHVTSGDGSMLFFNSSDEKIPIAAAREMNRALAAAGVPHTLVVFKNSTKHARQYECDPALVDGQTLTVIDDSIRWLGGQLGQPTTPTGTFCP